MSSSGPGRRRIPGQTWGPVIDVVVGGLETLTGVLGKFGNLTP